MRVVVGAKSPTRFRDLSVSTVCSRRCEILVQLIQQGVTVHRTVVQRKEECRFKEPFRPAGAAKLSPSVANG
jgi:hypothetical protein